MKVYPSVFIGSCQEDLELAKLVEDHINEAGCATVNVWCDLFGLNENYLYSLLEKLKNFDFAIFILSGNDKLNYRMESGLTPRNNILLESGISLGFLGIHNTFLLCDRNESIKLPSDLDGLTLAEYNGSDLNSLNKKEVLKPACLKIIARINEQQKNHKFLLGRWRSHYLKPYEEYKSNDEIVNIVAFHEGITISTQESHENDFYTATGTIINHQVFGSWASVDSDNDGCGVFLLIIEPDGKFMYGYFTTSDETNKVKITYWVLVKEKEEINAPAIDQLFTKAKKILAEATILPPV